MMKLAKSLLASMILLTGTAMAEPGIVEINIEGITFVPANVVVEAGQTVRWTNTSEMTHTVTLDPSLAANAENIIFPEGAELFDSGRLAPGAVYERTFTVPGRYRYICKPHERMGHIGEFEVVPAGTVR
jgi:plastocyanin